MSNASSIPFQHQVSGHSNSIHFLPNSNSSIIKSSTATERHFYSEVAKTLTDRPFAGVWIPEFWGTVKRKSDGMTRGEGALEQDGLESVSVSEEVTL